MLTQPTPVRGWFILEPPKPKLPLLLRIALIALIVTAVVLASHASKNGPATTQAPASTIPAHTPATDAP
ncbi:hypothetical protein [Streptomyces flaveus]|uniref:hypothetical protein n=1 Tax=Streptomyces flaveus TaxID=66370 RepID=UPI00332E3191